MSVTSDAWPIYTPADAGQPLDAIVAHIASHGVYTVADATERATLLTTLTSAGVTNTYVVVRRLDAAAGREIEYTIDAGSTWRVVATHTNVAWATAAGQSTVNVAGSSTATLAVTFPTSRFTVAPVVILTPSNTGYNVGASGVSATGFTINARHINDTSATLSFNCDWFAVQMLTGAAAG